MFKAALLTIDMEATHMPIKRWLVSEDVCGIYIQWTITLLLKRMK